MLSCAQCCVKQRTSGEREFYHQSLGAVLVHPDIKGIALPLGFEPITREDGANKNDCERNASKRLLSDLASAWPQRRFVVLEDALAANGPHLQLLEQLGMDFIIGVKPAGNATLFDEVSRRQIAGELLEWQSDTTEQGCCSGYRISEGLALNKSHPDLRVNYLEWWEVDKTGRQTVFTWVSNLAITAENAAEIARAGRARWRIENETFNTLKNQGYGYEHNYGHGKKYLSSTLAGLMMLAFFVDQIQECACRVYRQARATRGPKSVLWIQMRSMMTAWRMTAWEMMLDLMIDPDRVFLNPDTG